MRHEVGVKLGLILAASAVVGPATAQTPPSQETMSAPVIQVGIDLIRIDASVTDERGRPVTDLKPEDFKLRVGGNVIPVLNVAFFTSTAINDSTATTEPRSLVFVVDDLSTSFESMRRARQAIAAFASTAGSDTFLAVRMTSDRSDDFKISRDHESFRTAAFSMKYEMRSDRKLSGSSTGRNPNIGQVLRAGSDVTDMQPVLSDPRRLAQSGRYVNPDSAGGNSAQPFVRHNYEQRLWSLLNTINSLRSVPGRKAVVFVSEGLSVGRRLPLDSPFESLFADSNDQSVARMIAEVANRASVVIYTIDPSGLGGSGEKLLAKWGTQGTLARLASDTGGLSVFNRNELLGGIADVVNDQRAYYLLGFEPPDLAFTLTASGQPRFHDIKLTVDRPGVRVRTRAGFYGVTDDHVRKTAPGMSTPTAH
jgi:VWFA-related protein